MSVFGEMVLRDPAARLRRLAPTTTAQAGSRASAAELALLIGIGAAAAMARSWLRLRMGVPGHSIVLVVPPLVLGLACVPRRKAGAVMGASALGTGLLLHGLGLGGAAGAGALASLFLTGMALEAALGIARTPRGIYLGCAAAGVAANLGAFAVRLLTKFMGLSGADVIQPASIWWLRAAWTYPLCGAVAGLGAAALLFRASAERRDARLNARLTVAVLLCAAGLAAAAYAVSGARAKPARLGEEFSATCGRRLGRLVAGRMAPGSRVAIISGELAGTRSLQRRAEVVGLRRGLEPAGIRVAKVILPVAGTDLDEESAGASRALLQRAAAVDGGVDAVISLAGLPARPTDLGETLVFAYQQRPAVAQRWIDSGACAGLLIRRRGDELVEWPAAGRAGEQ